MPLPPALPPSLLPSLQIQEMARMTPAQRLELLKEVGGTKVYEERRKESVKIMNETEARRNAVSAG